MAKVGNVGLGFGVASGEAPTAPAAPTITVVAGSDSLTVSVTGDAGVMHTVFYKPSAVSTWAIGGARTGDGVLTLSDLTQGAYHVIAYSSKDGANSVPGRMIAAVIAVTSNILTAVEAWAVATLTAMTDDAGQPLFKNIEMSNGAARQKPGAEKCVDHWLGQVGTNDGGIASFARYCPFAFVKAVVTRVAREGGYDANCGIELNIFLGQRSEAAGVCRIGSDTVIGANRIFEQVFLTFDGQHPGSGIACDDFFLTDAGEPISSNKMCGIELEFRANWIPLK